LGAAAQPSGHSTGIRPSAPVRSGGWHWFGNVEERAARRAYRHSLPPLYRWRRVIIGVVATAAAVALVSIVSGNPVEWAKQRWYDVTGETVPVADVTATPDPPGSDAPGAAGGAVDPDASTYWARTWVAGSSFPVCGAAEEAGTLVLSWQRPVRVRTLVVSAGLRQEADNRDLQHRPRHLHVRFRASGSSGAFTCLPFELDDTATPQPLEVDSNVDVSELRVSVASVFPSNNEDQDGPVSIRRAVVETRP